MYRHADAATGLIGDPIARPAIPITMQFKSPNVYTHGKQTQIVILWYIHTGKSSGLIFPTNGLMAFCAPSTETLVNTDLTSKLTYVTDAYLLSCFFYSLYLSYLTRTI